MTSSTASCFITRAHWEVVHLPAERHISTTLWGTFFKLGTNVHRDSRMTWPIAHLANSSVQAVRWDGCHMTSVFAAFSSGRTRACACSLHVAMVTLKKVLFFLRSINHTHENCNWKCARNNQIVSVEYFIFHFSRWENDTVVYINNYYLSLEESTFL